MGIIDNAVDTTTKAPNPLGGPDITQSKSFGYDPTLGTVNNSTDSVSGQLDAILGKDNPYVTRARAGAAADANSRGLLNSSMAAGAGESAAIGAALPIAQQDASTYSQQRLVNQGASNAASSFDANAANTAGQFNTGQTNQFGIIGANMGAQEQLQQKAADIQTGQVLPATTAAQKELTAAQGEQTRQTQAAGATQAEHLSAQQAAQATSLQAAKAGFDTALQSLRGDQATQLSNIEANYRQLIQTSASAATTMTTTTQAIAAIMADTNTSTAQKQAGVNTITNLLKDTLSVIGTVGNVDLTSILNFNVGP